MNESNRLTDAQIQAAFERRAGQAHPGDLRETILSLTAVSSQRSPWRLRLRSPMSTLVLRPVSLRGIATATVIGVIAIGAAFFVMRPRVPAVGGPTPTPGDSTTASPTATPPVTVASPRAATWTATGSMITPRLGHMAFLLLDGRVLVLGGPIETINPANTAELYDPDTGAWSGTGSMLAPRIEYSATLLSDGKVLVAGGVNSVVLAGGTIDGPLVSAELYDPVSGTWTATGAMETPRYGHTATLLGDGRVLVAGGNVAGDAADDQMPPSELYDPLSGTWTPTGAMAADRYGHTATLLPDGRVLVVGGYQDGSPNGPFAELYDPLSGTWTAAGTMATMRSSHTATLLPNGTVLVAGGYIRSTRDLCGQPSGTPSVDCTNPLASAELYDPQTGAWSATRDMVEPRAGHTATLLPDGRVLVAGGGGSAEVSACQCHAPVGSAELYDPASGTWSATATMIAVRRDHTATLLADGRVLVAAGFGMQDGMGSIELAAAELYDPGTGR